MLIVAIALGVVTAGLVIVNGLNSSRLVANTTVSRAVVLGSVVAATLSGLMIFETVQPAAPTAQGELKKVGDTLDLGHAGGGVLYLECKRLDGVKAKSTRLKLQLTVKGSAGKQTADAAFQVGDSHENMDNPTMSHMAANIGIKPLGDGTTVTLSRISSERLVSVHAAYRPARFPFQWALITLLVLVALAAAFEGATPPGWQRTFLTVTLSGVAAFVWLLENGLTSDDSVSTLWIRLAYSVIIGAVAGTLLPAVLGRFVPTLEAPTKKSDAPETAAGAPPETGATPG